MKKTALFIVLCSFAIALTHSSCEEEVTLPKVTTAEVTDVTQSAATCGGEVTSDGNSTTTRGVCWSPADTPTIEDNHTVDGTGEGVFVSEITGLAPNVTYYVRAYATNSQGTAYGLTKEFKTPL